MGSIPDEENGLGAHEEKESASCDSIKATSETVLTERTRTSLPIIAAWWKTYHRDDGCGVQIDEDGIYKCIREKDSPPSDEIELSTSTDIVTSSAYHVRLSRNTLRLRILDCMKSVNLASVQILEDIASGKTTGDNAEPVLSASPIGEKNIIFLWAALYKRLDLLEILFKYGVDINFYEPTEGFAAIHISAFNDNVECTKFLISCGVDVNYTPEKYTPLETACFHNSFKVAKVLLDNGAKVNAVRQIQNKDHIYQGTPLHSAVRSNSIDCVQLLLTQGANVESREAEEVSPLHIAAEMGHIRCIEILLASGANPNASVSKTMITPLHLAADGGFNECLALLVSKGAKVDMKNCKGQTALHLAARAQSLECVEVLLKKGGCDPNCEDNENRTPLHSAVGKSVGSFEITDYLINHGAQVNNQDIYGYTPLHVAALNEHTQCVEILINNGADVSIRTIGGNTALGIIVRKTPLALPQLYKKLDSAITVHDPEVSSSKEVVMKLDFRIFLQRYQKGEMDFLKTFLDEGQKDILKHPLCQAFLHVKWEKIRKYYIARLIFYGILVLCLTSYVFTVFHSCYIKIISDKNNTNYSYICEENETAESFYQDKMLLIKSQQYTLIFFTVCEAIRKSSALIGSSSIRAYIFHIDNVMEWFVLISSILISCWPIAQSDWQNHVAAFCVLFAWINLMLLIGQLPVLGSYVAMYIKVQKEFGKLFVAYLCLLIGFTFSFCVIFPAKMYFKNPFYGFIQVIAMMIGSVEYNDLFFEDEKTLVIESGHVIFLVFMLFGTIIMMNLLVGIAVRDIQGLQKTAGLSRLTRQTKLITSIEMSLLKTWLPRYILLMVRHTALVSPSGYRVVLHVKPLNRQEKRLPKVILKDAYDIGKSRKHGVNIPSVRSRILSFIASKSNSSSQLQPETQINTQRLYEEMENITRAIARLSQDIQELKSMRRSMKL